MSRAASMQVLNNAFSNFNNAMASIMQNNRQNRAMDMQQQYHNDLLRLRQELADRAQANADRTYNYNVSKDAQAQANRDKLFDYKAEQDAQARADAERQQAEQKAREQELATQNDFKEMFGISKVYGADMAEAYARAKAGDPVAKNMFLQGVEQHNQKQEIQKRYAGLLANLDATKKEREKQAIAQKKADAAYKIKPSDVANLVSNGVMTAEEGKAYLDANYGELNTQKTMTPEQALQAYKDGKISKEQLANIRKQFK